jgi:hypothetical protein
MASSRGLWPDRGAAIRRAWCAAILLVAGVAVATAQTTPGAADESDRGEATAAQRESVCLTSALSAGLAWPYHRHGRDLTFAGAPVVVTTGRAHLDLARAPLRATASARLLTPIARRGDPWQTAAADTIEGSLGASARLLRDGALLVSAGTTVALHYGAMLASGAAYGQLAVEPWLGAGLGTVRGEPRIIITGSLVPDQVGWREGLEWSPRWETAWGAVVGYAGVFRPRDYAKQDSGSALQGLARGEPAQALVALLPSDATVGASARIRTGERLVIEPHAELLLVFLRAQNPRQLAPSAGVTIHVGSPAAAAHWHEGR